MQRHAVTILLLAAAVALAAAAAAGLFDNYVLTVLMFMGINIIFASSLNLVNGHMGEFSCGHGGFMCVGAYVGSVLSVVFFTGNKILGGPIFPPEAAPFLFPLVLVAATLAAALFGLIVALPSFHTRDDYLAIITIAANYIIISIVENIDAIGGPRGFSGMKRTMTAMEDTLRLPWLNAMGEEIKLPWMLIWVMIGVFVCITVLRRLVSSTYGKGIPAVCQNEVAAEIMGVNTNRVKIMAFMVSSGLAGLAGVLYAHVYGYVNAQAFNILKSTEGLVMVYLGGMGSISGVILAAVAFTLLVEALRFVIPAANDFLHVWGVLPPAAELSQIWKWVIIPLILILLMQLRPEGLLGNKELTHVFPRLKRWVSFK
jgi:branched-chain amino acid transport system permease protein